MADKFETDNLALLRQTGEFEATIHDIGRKSYGRVVNALQVLDTLGNRLEAEELRKSGGNDGAALYPDSMRRTGTMATGTAIDQEKQYADQVRNAQDEVIAANAVRTEDLNNHPALVQAQQIVDNPSARLTLPVDDPYNQAMFKLLEERNANMPEAE